ncbi:class I SAM-dependent methyltransferase [Kiloniella spongiae]|uniref:class I SAM-dependent methyltransferase n=1 Tax=Kiloniella spongiae TaxID=1489064 RepID=UPI000699E416|nr:class I SAM-dependent methyltransferase [Kiloniella spongiae]
MDEIKEQNNQGDNGPDKWCDEVALRYVEKYGEHPINRLTAEQAQLEKSDYVLDIGCGSGSALRAAGEIVTTGELIGVDPSPVMVRVSQEESLCHPAFPRMRFLLGGAEAIPLSCDQVTVAWAINTFHHWEDIPLGLSEVQRVLKSGGRFIVVEEVFEDRIGMTPESVLHHLKEAGFECLDHYKTVADGAKMDVLTFRNLKI